MLKIIMFVMLWAIVSMVENKIYAKIFNEDISNKSKWFGIIKFCIISCIAFSVVN